jgi:hypothetical protein
MFLLQITMVEKWPTSFTKRDWRDTMLRLALVWTTTIPKATLQGALGPKVGRTHDAPTLLGCVSTQGSACYPLACCRVAPLHVPYG